MLQYPFWWYLFWGIVAGIGSIGSWIEMFVLDRRKASGASMTYAVGAVICF
jgi:hypothetical protein